MTDDKIALRELLEKGSDAALPARDDWLCGAAADGTYPSGECRGWVGSGDRGGVDGAPVPWQQLVQAGRWMIGNSGEDVGEPSAWADAIELRSDDERRHRRCSLSSTIGAGKQPRLPSECDPAQRPFGSIVRQAGLRPSRRNRLNASQRLSM